MEHDYINGHTCPSCGKSGIPCTIEDGFCENSGDCDNCIKEQVYREMEAEDDPRDWENECQECGRYIGDDCTCEAV